jgi:hypothetical protein
MKFAKGLLDDVIVGDKPQVAKAPAPVAALETRSVAPAEPPVETPRPVVIVEKEHLFETQQKVVESSRNYLKIFGIVVILIAVAGTAIFYFTLPGIGDRIRVSREMEDAVRAHFLEKEKRTADDITFYKCDQYTWARTEVETRTDIPGNPLAKVNAYATRITDSGNGTFQITATPITSPEIDTPCR